MPPPDVGLLPARLRNDFERDGFLHLPQVLPAAVVGRLLAATDAVVERSATGFNSRNFWQLRNCVAADDAFLELIDWPETLPIVVGLLGWNIQLLTSHLLVRAPSPPDVGDGWMQAEWHRDGGLICRDLDEPLPRLFVKVAFWLTDLREAGRGNLAVVPGSHRLTGRPPWQDGARDPDNALELLAGPGDVTVFEQRLWHGVGPNRSSIVRKCVILGYGYRWLRPHDYTTMPTNLLERVSPVRRQLLGGVHNDLGYILPVDDEVPLRHWFSRAGASRG